MISKQEYEIWKDLEKGDEIIIEAQDPDSEVSERYRVTLQESKGVSWVGTTTDGKEPRHVVITGGMDQEPYMLLAFEAPVVTEESIETDGVITVESSTVSYDMIISDVEMAKEPVFIG